MIYGLGVDITEIARIQKAQAKRADFAEKILTPAELLKFNSFAGKRAAEYLAGRFSVKEAYAKAYGTGLGEVGLQDVECLDNERGKPVITKHPFDGIAHVSISHTDALVMTEVILEVTQ